MYLDGKERFSKQDIIDFKNALRNGGYQEASINNKITSVNKYLVYLKQDRFKVATIRLQRETDLDNVLTLEDYKRLLRWARKSSDEETELMIKVFAKTGIRVGELKFFTVESLGKKIKVTNKGKTRNVPISKELLHDLKKYCRDKKIKSGPIFPSRIEGKTLAASTVFRRMKRIAGKAKVSLERVHPHSFRHFFALEFLASGGNEYELADILGHERMDTTRIYARSSNKNKIEQIGKMRI